MEEREIESWVVSSVQSLSRVRLFATPWTAARQASLSITNSRSLLKLRSIEWCHSTISSFVIHFFSHLQSFPASGSFQMSQFFKSGGQSIGVSASASWVVKLAKNWIVIIRVLKTSFNTNTMLAKLFQSCLSRCNSMNWSLPGSSVLGILQARILEWVATSSSRWPFRPKDWALVSYVFCFGRGILYHQGHLGS